ncbi:unnamed protein product [Polarella glacialis]|uniref:Uncharacterized protein n=1 Tax=Polarella glacialis TaxID=89957 RepID=A0A813HUJ2_POLGL|nr:unnamed protein product [Polarella glacialis]
MAPANLAELTGFKSQACHHWDYHPLVGLSSLCFIPPASAFLAVWLCLLCTLEPPYPQELIAHLLLYPMLGLLFTIAIFTCASADCLYIRRGHRSWYGRVDIRLASGTLFVAICDFAFRASLLETAVLVLIAAVAFIYSGASTSFEQWVFRHSLWHVTAGAVATYGAFRQMPAGNVVAGRVLPYFLVAFGVYALVALATLAFFSQLSSHYKAELWKRGAEYADWRPVAQEPERDKLKGL